jgi:hypothetical protein
LLLVPLAISVAIHTPAGVPWYKASLESSGLAPNPTTVRESVVQVYAARAYGWRGAVAVHTWIIVKRSGAPAFTRYDVVGWGGAPVVRTNYAAADALWYGGRPELLLDRRGEEVEVLIDQIEAAVTSYPFAQSYRSWPGPNSNTFIAHIGRSVPALRLDLPANAIGKLSAAHRTARTRPSGTSLRSLCPGSSGCSSPWRKVEIDLLDYRSVWTSRGGVAPPRTRPCQFSNVREF